MLKIKHEQKTNLPIGRFSHFGTIVFTTTHNKFKWFYLVIFLFLVRRNSVISDTCAKVHYEKDARKIQMYFKYAAEILDFCSIHSTVNPYPRQNHSWIKLDMF